MQDIRWIVLQNAADMLMDEKHSEAQVQRTVRRDKNQCTGSDQATMLAPTPLANKLDFMDGNNQQTGNCLAQEENYDCLFPGFNRALSHATQL